MAFTASTILSESVVLLKVTESSALYTGLPFLSRFLITLPASSSMGLPSLSFLAEESKVSFMLMVSPSMLTLLELRVISISLPLMVAVNLASWPLVYSI